MDELQEAFDKIRPISDEELLAPFYTTNTNVQDDNPPPSLEPLGNTENWELIELEPDWNYRDGILGEMFDYMGGHPLSTIINMKLPLTIGGSGKKWLPVKGITAGAQILADPIGYAEESLLPALGQRNTQDSWTNTIWNTKLKDMTANPEDYAE